MPALRRPTGAHDIYEVPRRKEDLPKTYGSDRRCRICSSRLSKYNPNAECWSHSHSDERLEDLAALMEAA